MTTASARRLRWLALLVPIGALAPAAYAQFPHGYSYQTGQDLYTHICQGCHMPDGKGAIGAGMYPALSGDPKLRAPLYPVLVILKGQKAMPSFSDLTDAQVVEVTNYIRANFGNTFAGQVTLDQVKALRASAVRQTSLAPG